MKGETMTMLNRRQFLASAGAAGLGLALPAEALAARNRDHRLVVMVLRGGMDGLDLLAPLGDPDYRRLRPNLAANPDLKGGHLPLTDFYGLHPAVAGIKPLFQAGELGFVQAVATPYRARSHFDGQDVLENGTGDPASGRGGWLNRTVGLLAPGRRDYAANVGRASLPILNGPNRVAGWSPDSRLPFSDTGVGRLKRLYARDPLFAKALNGALMAQAKLGDGDGRQPAHPGNLARMAAKFLKPADGARLAAFNLGGWDTHGQQTTALRQPMQNLAEALTVLKAELGPAWAHTVVLGITEFGRTVRENGTKGTDHGTASAMLFAGGAVNGGQVLGRFPGLAEGRLYVDRDLMPTDDTRRLAAWVLKARFGLSNRVLSGTVFPGLDLGRDPGLL